LEGTAASILNRQMIKSTEIKIIFQTRLMHKLWYWLVH